MYMYIPIFHIGVGGREGGMGDDWWVDCFEEDIGSWVWEWRCGLEGRGEREKGKGGRGLGVVG